MGIVELAGSARTVRRFQGGRPVPQRVLTSLLETARLAPCGANLQELRYSVVTNAPLRAGVFDTLKWAAYLRDWPGPAEDERPSAYVIVFSPQDEKPFTRIDAGIASGYMTLAAREAGLGSCMLLSFDREALLRIIQPPPGMHALLVIALGYPAEMVEIEDLAPGGSVEYWRDEREIHRVPKRRLPDIIHGVEGAEGREQHGT